MNAPDHITAPAFRSCAVAPGRVMLARDPRSTGGDLAVLGYMSAAMALRLADQLRSAAHAAGGDCPTMRRPLRTPRPRSPVFVGQSSAMR